MEPGGESAGLTGIGIITRREERQKEGAGMDTVDTKTRVADAKAGGYCCSESVMKLGLEDLGIEDENLIKAMVAFCGGMGAGQVCGALAAAAALMCIVDEKKEAKTKTRIEVIDWFKGEFGAVDCPTLIDGDDKNKDVRCPGYIEAAYEHVHEMLKERKLV
jgi:C_GCAxxG_C_C family probable redox protein